MLRYMPLVGSVLLTIIIAGFIFYWVYQSRRKIGVALKGPIRSLCCNADISDIVWTADGWVAACRACGGWQYFGDNEYEAAGILNTSGGVIKACDEQFDMRPPGEVVSIDSRRLAPRPAAIEPGVVGQRDARLTGKSPALGAPYGGAEVTSDYYPVKKARAAAHIARAFGDEGEPLAAPPQPNLGGEGNPDYEGPHYLVQHDRFVPYEVLRDPIPGAAVHIVGKVACVGPLAVEGDRGDATLDISREDEDGQ